LGQSGPTQLQFIHRIPIWYYHDHGYWIPISSFNNYRIEQARETCKKKKQKMPQIYITEGANTSILSYFTGKRLKVDVTNSQLLYSGKQFAFEIEGTIETYKNWAPDEDRAYCVSSEKLSLNDAKEKALEYKKVRYAFHLTLPQRSIITITKFHGDRSQYVLANARLKFINTKLLWGWNFRIENPNQKENNDHIILNPEKDTEKDSTKFGPGYYFASDAAIAQHFNTQNNNLLVLSQVSLGKTYYYTDNNPKAYYYLPNNSYHTLAVKQKVKVDSKEIEGWIYVIPQENRIFPIFLVSYK